MVIHPGIVDTDMLRSLGKDIQAITTQESVEKMLKVILNAKLEDSGKFFSYTGDILSW